MVCLGKVFWGYQKRSLEGAWNSLGSCIYPVYRSGRNFVILDSSVSCLVSSPSINHVSSTFRTYLEFDHSSPLCLTQATFICHLVMGLASQSDFLFLPLPTSICSPQDHQSAMDTVCQVSGQYPPMAFHVTGVRVIVITMSQRPSWSDSSLSLWPHFLPLYPSPHSIFLLPGSLITFWAFLPSNTPLILLTHCVISLPSCI